MSTFHLLVTASRYGGELKQDDDVDDIAKAYNDTHEAVDEIKSRLYNFITVPGYLPMDDISQLAPSFLDECTSLDEIAMFIKMFCCDDAGCPDFTWFFVRMQGVKVTL